MRTFRSTWSTARTSLYRLTSPRALTGGAASVTLEAPCDFLDAARCDEPAHQVVHAGALEAQHGAQRGRQLGRRGAVDFDRRQPFGRSAGSPLARAFPLVFDHRDGADAASVLGDGRVARAAGWLRAGG